MLITGASPHSCLSLSLFHFSLSLTLYLLCFTISLIKIIKSQIKKHLLHKSRPVDPLPYIVSFLGPDEPHVESRFGQGLICKYTIAENSHWVYGGKVGLNHWVYGRMCMQVYKTPNQCKTYADCIYFLTLAHTDIYKL